ncbi:MAG: biotin transporter BioY [Burkholderiaceae bacterium]
MTDSTTVDNQTPSSPSGWGMAGQGTLAWLVTVCVGVAALTLGAKVSVPFWPVPMSMQVVALATLAMVLGMRHAVHTVLAYLALGLAGLPVFVSSVGPAAFVGPTGGYLLGFVAAAAVMGRLAQRGWNRSFSRAMLAMSLGLLAMYALGLTWLGHVVGWDKPILALGLKPFILGDLLKITLVAWALPLLHRLRRR